MTCHLPESSYSGAQIGGGIHNDPLYTNSSGQVGSILLHLFPLTS